MFKRKEKCRGFVWRTPKFGQEMKYVIRIVITGLALMMIPATVSGQFTAPELLGRPTDQSVTVNVVPSQNMQVYYEYGTVSGAYTGQTTTTSATSGQPHESVISGLSANTMYYYRIRYSTNGGSTWSSGTERSFHTQRAPGSTFRFSITSDSHVNIMLGSATTWRQTLANVVGDGSDFHIDLGDTFAMDNVTTQSGADQAYLYQRTNDFFDEVNHSLPLFLAIGNHEQEEGWHLDDTGNPLTSPPVMGTNARKKYYPNPIPDAFYTGNTDTYASLDGDQLHEDYYAWQWGDALFIILDPFWYTTTKPFTGNTGGGEGTDTGSGDRWDWTLGQAQFNWFKDLIVNSTASYKFVFAHHMTGGSDDYVRGGAVPAHLVEWGGYNEAGTVYEWAGKRAGWGNDPVKKLMEDHGVSAFFHGHDHQYAYELRDGVVYHSLPAAGFSGSGFNIYSEANQYTERVLPSPGHLRVTVTPQQATVDYIATSGGGVNHTYTILPNAPAATHDLTIAAEPVGTGATTPALGVHTYTENAVVNITAIPAPGYAFDQWTGPVADAGSSSTTVTMGSDVSVSASFIPARSGDINGDKAYNSTDALVILLCEAGITSIAQFCPCNCGDVNGDGVVNSTDALIILINSAGIPNSYQVGTADCPTSGVTPCPGCSGGK